MASAFQDLKYTVIAKVMSMALLVGVQSCLAWWLGAAGRGEYAVCQVFASLLTVFCALGCDTASVYFVSSQRFSISEGVIHAAVCVAVSSVVAITFGLILRTLPVGFFSKASQDAFGLALASIPTALMSLILLQLLTAVRMFRWFAVLSILQIATHLCCVCVFVGYFSWGVKGALWAIIVRDVLIVTAALTLLRVKLGMSWAQPTLGKLYKMYHYGTRYYFGKISNRVNARLGTMILAFFATKEQIGLFDVAHQLTAQVITVPDSLSTVLLPRMCQAGKNRADTIARAVRMTAAVCGSLLLVLCVFARPIITILFSRDFLAAVPLVRILSLGVLVRCTCKLFVPYLIGSNRPGTVSVSVVAGVAVNILSLIVLLPSLGLSGAAVANSLGYAVSSLLLARGFVNHSGTRLSRVFRYQPSDFRMLKPWNGVVRG
ncbi:MAG: oligosaccharide flippase family protein [Phycisphaerales bacterium]|nr:MAG: oligosaccharide flippase family protein [Phycisphaerales bacterium]